jgi:hypothetical protein
LRLSVLAAFGLYDIGLTVAVALLCWKSVKNSGLVNDDGSSALFFASMFLSTILAVAYVLVANIVLDDVKRTECDREELLPG